MNKIRFFGLLCILTINSNYFIKAQSADIWKRLETLIDVRRVDDATTLLDSIEKAAIAQKDTVLRLKTVLERQNVWNRYEENAIQKTLDYWKSQAPLFTSPAKEIIYANIAVVLREDYQKSIYYAGLSLANPLILQRTDIRKYQLLLKLGERYSIDYQPSLYDLLVRNALTVFSVRTNYGHSPELFEIDDPQYLSDAKDFVNLKITSKDSLSQKYKTLLIFQQLIAFHLNDSNKSALILADLDRLSFVYQNYIFEDKAPLYERALNSLFEQYQNVGEASTNIYRALASFWNMQGNLYEFKVSEAHRYDKTKALKYAQACPKIKDSEGSKNCNEIAKEIESHFYSIETEEVYPPKKALLAKLQFKNVQHLQYRIYSLTPEQRNEYLSRRFLDTPETLTFILSLKNFSSHELKLPDMGDYQMHNTEFKLTENLSNGFYLLLAFADSLVDKKFQATHFQVSNLGSMSFFNNEYLEGFVFDRSSGKRLKNVAIDVIQQKYDYKTRLNKNEVLTTVHSNSEGAFSIKEIKNNSNYILYLRSSKDQLIDQQAHYANSHHAPPFNSVLLFTDRSIYRPGDKVYFKGIYFEENADTLRTINFGSTEAVIFDIKGAVVAKVAVEMNHFGSFAGSFVLPKDASGMMTLAVGEQRFSFNVDAYKRPQIEVLLDTIRDAYKINDLIPVSGKVMNYAGNPAGNVKIKYSITYSIGPQPFPYFLGKASFFYTRNTPSVIICDSITETDSNGIFRFNFKATAVKNIKQPHPVHTYFINIQAIDVNNETQSNSTALYIGERTLTVNTNLEDDINIQNFLLNVSSVNFNGQHIPSKGEIRIFKKEPKSTYHIQRLWNTEDIDLNLISEKDFKKNFPLFEYLLSQNEHSDSTIILFNTNDTTMRFPNLPQGKYKAFVYLENETEACSASEFTVFSTETKAASSSSPLSLIALQKKVAVGQKAQFLISSSAENAEVYYECWSGEKRLQTGKIRLSNSQQMIEVPVKKTDINGINLIVYLAKDHRFFNISWNVEVDLQDQINIELNTFRDKIRPGEKEAWKIRLTDKTGKPVNAELLASMYDASLDVFSKADWSLNLYPKNYYSPRWESNLYSTTHVSFYNAYYQVNSSHNLDRLQDMSRRIMRSGGSFAAMPNMSDGVAFFAKTIEHTTAAVEGTDVYIPKTPQFRSNFNELAFFYPQLLSDSNGIVNINFTAPDALTRWNFRGVAHTQNLAHGEFSASVVTQKELMLQPNRPRFVRAGDTILFSCKISNLTENDTKVDISLEFETDLQKAILSNAQISQLPLKANESANLTWLIAVPENLLLPINYKIFATNGKHTDGEANSIPVLPNALLVNDSRAINVDGNETKEYSLQTSSTTEKDSKITLDICSNPVWYAIEALPYLNADKDDNSLQTFNKYYANALSAYLASNNPEITSVFKQWNQLFDENQLYYEKQKTLENIFSFKTPDGGFSWCKNGPANRYITQYIILNFNNLHKRTNNEQNYHFVEGIYYMDREICNDYKLINPELKREQMFLNPLQIQYLLARSMYMQSFELDSTTQIAFDFYTQQARKYWQKQNLYSQAMLILFFDEIHDSAMVQNIVNGFKQTAIDSPELGVYWRMDRGYYWYQSPIETQALIIRAFERVNEDKVFIDKMKTYLLTHKRTNRWPSNKSTAEAAFALLDKNPRINESQNPVEIQIGKQLIESAKLPANEISKGFGSFSKTWTASEITPDMYKINVANKGQGRIWGGFYREYYERADKVKSSEQFVKLRKRMYVQHITPKGIALDEIKTGQSIKVSDKVTVRIELESDRDLEFVTMKDARAAALEPTQTLSAYQWAKGINYYQITRDISTDFMFDRLPKGKFVIEYELVASQKGHFLNGICEIQCTYAPEFSAHTEGIKITVE